MPRPLPPPPFVCDMLAKLAAKLWLRHEPAQVVVWQVANVEPAKLAERQFHGGGF
jgi:hypothetical protein